MDYDNLVKYIQNHFADGLVLVIGSGLSSAEGIPGMPDLAAYLIARSGELSGAEASRWNSIQSALEADEGLEAALLKHAPTVSLEDWIVKCTCDLLIPKEREIITAVVSGIKTLRLTALLNKILKPKPGLPILTPNYDRLIEVACEMAGYHVDTTAIGPYAGLFDHEKSCMASCKGIINRTKITTLDHFPRAIVLKPHGSFDWYKTNTLPRRCCLELNGSRLIITPGLNKYKAGYDAPFDKHRDLANDHIKRSARLLIVGYGFNDDHLQTYLIQHIKNGAPTLILSLAASPMAIALAKESPNCVCISKATAWDGISVVAGSVQYEHKGHNLWDIEVISRELL